MKRAFRKRVREEPYATKLGMRLVEVGEGHAKVEMDVTAEMDNIFGMLHGGAIFSLIDEAFEVSCNSHGTVALALNVNISYLAAPEPGSRLTAQSREINRTRKTGLYDIRVTDDKGRLIATAQALAYRKPDPLPFP